MSASAPWSRGLCPASSRGWAGFAMNAIITNRTSTSSRIPAIATTSRSLRARIASRHVLDAPTRVAPRILILTTDIGEGHDLPARQLAEGIADECPGAEVAIADGLAAMGKLLSAVIKDQSRVIFKMPAWVWNVEHWLAIRFAPTSWLARTLNYALGSRGLLRLIRSHAPDIVVSTYPGTTMVLGMLRSRGKLKVPTVGAITDLAELRYWAMPGVDLHLVTHEESIPEVRALAPSSDVRWVRGLTSAGFTEPADPAE